MLGSGSEARKNLLEQVGLKPDKIRISNINEAENKNEAPIDYVNRMATQKSLAIKVNEMDFLLTADTIVVTGKRIIHKTDNRILARQNLRKLCGRRHRVYTAFCVRHQNKTVSGYEKTFLKMKYLTDPEIESYLDGNEWINRAGGYAIQGVGMSLFPHINGCFSNVVGLPLPRIINKLKGIGYYKTRNHKQRNTY